jgi:uncharacterized damage-inducible protein DinB
MAPGAGNRPGRAAEVEDMDYLEYYRYLADCRVKVLAAVQALPAGAVDRRPAGGRHSLRGLLNHLLAIEAFWLDGVLAGGDPPEDEIGLTLVELENAFAERRRATETILRGLTPDQLRKDTRAPWDSSVRFRLDKVLLHFFTHEAHHRGQLCLLIRMLGGEPPDVDVL